MGQKSTSATSGNQGFLLWGAQSMYALTFGAGQKNNQYHGTVALARWAPLIIMLCLSKNDTYYSGRNFALLEFREMRDLEPKISRNLRNSQGIEIPMILLLYENTSSYFLSPKNAKLLVL